MQNSAQTKQPTRAGLNARFHQLLSQNHCDADDKAAIVHQVSGGRYTSSRDLSDTQLLDAIKVLDGLRNQSIKKMRAKAINKAKELGILPDEIYIPADWKGLNTFCQNTFQKNFNQLTFDELRNCITGLENWQDNRRSRAIKELLS